MAKSLEQRIQRMKDAHEISNLMAKYSYYHTAGMDDVTVEMFAQKTPGVRVTMSDLGTWEGLDGLKRFYLGFLKYSHGDRIGQMTIHTLTTPVIEVAGDGKTAKAVLLSPGVIAGKNAEGNLQSGWNWVKAAQDFVKEDGKWKFWHIHMYEIFNAPYGKSFIDLPAHTAPNIPEEFKPDIPGTKDYFYSTTSVQILEPVPPEPYETFDEKTAY